MAVYKIKDFSEIDFVKINPAEDVFVLPDGKEYQFSDHICDFCWAGGTVLESAGNEKKYVCTLCHNELTWHEIKNDFLPPTGDTLRFLLPESWSQERIKEWFEGYKERRLAQEEVRKDILENGIE